MQEETVQKVMETIEKKKLSPIPRWRFFLKYAVLWIFGGVSILSGAIAFSLVLLLLFNEDWVEYRLLHGSFLNALFRTFPFVWGITFLLFLLVAYTAIRHTKHGYRFRLWVVVGLNIIFSLFFGSILYVTGISHWVDYGLGQRVPGYFPVEKRREMRWFHPEEGKIVGEVQEVGVKDATLLLRDPLEKEWTVHIEDQSRGSLENVHVGMIVGLSGEVISDEEFNAETLRILPSPEERENRNGMGPRDGSGRMKEMPTGGRISK